MEEVETVVNEVEVVEVMDSKAGIYIQEGMVVVVAVRKAVMVVVEMVL